MWRFIAVFWRTHHKTVNLSHMFPFFTFTPYIFSNIVLSISMCHRWSLLLRFSDWNLVSFVICAICHICATCPIVLRIQFVLCPVCAVCPIYAKFLIFAACTMVLCVPFVLHVHCIVYPIHAACPIVLCVPVVLHVHLCCMFHVCNVWHFPVCPSCAACPIMLYVSFMLRVLLYYMSHSCCMSHCPVSPPMEAISFVCRLWMCYGVVERQLCTIVDNTMLREMWGSHGGVAEDSSLVGCDAVSLVEWLLTVQRMLLLICWTAEDKGTLFVQNIKTTHPLTVSYPGRS
jgi:hypothetical protein